ncbi:MAG: glutamine-hydrolyzing carbamoyl-phosphate synthase small subunit [Planctomycetaceae bacterium]|jgi:carbamoyl-phosphate synthase small subunit|nr:glutamine-hydrolyzing carbamoyl-phosphate synthase small subunit [Planctomycetaceae bacterium]
MQGYLALEDGRVFSCNAFGYEGIRDGEIVFNTSMTGYQEIISDPSYAGQIVTMTYPLIGNTGINPEDFESITPHVRGFIVREFCEVPSNWRATDSLDAFLKKHRIIGLTEIDTRAVTKHIREKGAMKAVIASGGWDAKELVRRAQDSPGLVGIDLVSTVTCREPYHWNEACPWLPDLRQTENSPKPLKIVAYDFGIKLNILRCLVSHGFNVTIVPAQTTAEEVLALKPDGVFLSNGPGDPAAVQYAIDAIGKLIGRIPVFGICLGHQLIGLALGGTTYKLKFGHRGANQPVKHLATEKIEITSQNHGFCVDPASLPPDVEPTHLNLNDHTNEGIRHTKHPVFSVQYHPESSAGPHDSDYLFAAFRDMIRRG